MGEVSDSDRELARGLPDEFLTRSGGPVDRVVGLVSAHWESYDNPARGGPQSGVVGVDGLFGCGFGQWKSKCLLGFIGEQIPDDESCDDDGNGGWG